ncbi:methyltransferase [Streptomyces sp. PR69]|uniref:methyltransferase n=1 Tax=Streptomyces sp. PR69 TaxID=2984950 RepID=UPI002263D1DB|nr:methyltransferase [Streptomyces sp. PR69]
MRLLFGGLAGYTVRAAVRLGVVEAIGDAELPAAEVADACGAQPQAMARLLRALTALGLLKESPAERDVFSVTPTGALLHPGRDGSMAALAQIFTDPVLLRGWELLDDSVRSGRPSFDTVFGTDFFGFLKDRPELSAQFNAAMSQGTSETAALLPHAYGFGGRGTVMDIGGGDGTLLAAVLAAHPDLKGILYDTKEGLAQSPATLERAGVADRCTAAVGDFFRSVPPGADLQLLKSVLHDWTDAQCESILGHCRAALAPGGRVLIIEPVMPEAVDPQAAGLTYLSDLNMLVNVGGRERTRRDFEELCGRAGLTVTSVTPLPAPSRFSLIEARPE